MGDHRIGQCVKCTLEDVEIAAHGLCYACYRAEQRTKERGGASLQRALHRQPAQLVKHYSSLMLAVAIIDTSDEGGSGLMEWVIERVEALVEPIKDYVAGQPKLIEKKLPDTRKRFKAYHEITTRLMGLGASREMISEIQGRIKLRLGELLHDTAGSLAAASTAPRAENDGSRSRSDGWTCNVVLFPQPPPSL
jgi:hypothetical protein